MKSIESHYKVLGLEPGVPFEKVKIAYKDLVAVWHPNRFTNNSRLQEKAQEKLKEINAAYEFLKNHKENEFSSNREFTIVPQSTQLKVGESIKFVLLENGNEVINEVQIDWSATGGIIRADGYFIANSDGRFTITATTEGTSSHALVYAATVTRETATDTKNDKSNKNKNRGSSKQTNIASEVKPEGFPLARLLIWGIVLVIFFTPEPHTLATFTANIAGVSLIAWIVGLINPNFVLRFGLPSNRRSVTLIYLTSFLFFGQLTQYFSKK